MKQKFINWATAGIGVACLLGGVIWGLAGSHMVSYLQSQQGVKYILGVGEKSGNVYIHAEGSSEYFVALSGDFNPAIAQSAIDNSADIGFIARPDTTQVAFTVNGKEITEAHKIEQLLLRDRTGAAIATYTTAEYTANPHGLYASAWGDAVWLVILGVMLTAAGIWSVVQKRNIYTNFHIGDAPVFRSAPPSVTPATQVGDPYSQAYQGPAQQTPLE